MTLTLEEVEHIADLARLHLDQEEKERYRRQLSTILDYFGRLQDLDTSTIVPTSSVLLSQGNLREDRSQPSLEREDLLRNAPQVEKEQFRVPPVLE